MARLRKGQYFSGLLDDLIFYQRWGTTYIRSKGSVTRERVLKSREYATTRQYANKMALASRIASPVYRALPDDRRAMWIFRSITGDAASLLYKGMSEKEVSETLWKKYIQDTGCNLEEIRPSAHHLYRSSKESKEKLRKLFLNRWVDRHKGLGGFIEAWRDPRAYDRESRKHLRDLFGLIGYDSITGKRYMGEE